jgi:hypothetical protein
MVVPRVLIIAWFIGAVRSIRTFFTCMKLTADRGGSLANHAARTTLGGEEADVAAMAFRDELALLAQECADVASREWRGGLEDFDVYTSIIVDQRLQEELRRQYRVKQ